MIVVVPSQFHCLISSPALLYCLRSNLLLFLRSLTATSGIIIKRIKEPTRRLDNNTETKKTVHLMCYQDKRYKRMCHWLWGQREEPFVKIVLCLSFQQWLQFLVQRLFMSLAMVKLFERPLCVWWVLEWVSVESVNMKSELLIHLSTERVVVFLTGRAFNVEKLRSLGQ